MPISEVHIDPLLPKLAPGTPPSLTTDEQKFYIKEILDLCCADSRFAEKAYVAILLVLAADAPPIPVPPLEVTGLTPNTIAVGAPDFTLHVGGTGFTAMSIVQINGIAAPTVYVSPTELTVDIDMGLVLAPVVAPITVLENAVVSNAMDFTVTL
jgi:hypothetical protein